MNKSLDSTKLHKVAVLCVRANRELLVFEHTGGGVQVPAGTVEPGEDIAIAAVRELAEETGMVVGSVTHLFSIEEQGDPDERVVAADVPLLAEPRESAAFVKPSLWRTWVRVRECGEEFTRVAVESWDLDRSPPVRTKSIDGFVLSAALLRSQQRHIFYAVAPVTALADTWEVFAEGMYTFRCRWVPLDRTGLLAVHQVWVDRARKSPNL